MRRIRLHLTYANVVSSLALFLVIAGGAAYAANTVFSGDIVDGQVKTVDLANGAVSVAKIADGGITGDKVKDGTLKGRDVEDNGLKGVDIDESTLSNIGGGRAGGRRPHRLLPEPADRRERGRRRRGDRRFADRRRHRRADARGRRPRP